LEEKVKNRGKVRCLAKDKILALQRKENIGVWRGNKEGEAPNTVTDTQFRVQAVEERGKGTGKGKARMMTIGQKSQFYNPLSNFSQKLADALDPAKAPSKGRSFKDMSPEEQANLRAKYERKNGGGTQV
jgi:hypothetical protein